MPRPVGGAMGVTLYHCCENMAYRLFQNYKTLLPCCKGQNTVLIGQKTALKSTALKSTALKSTALKSIALKCIALKSTALKSTPR